jgi:hypothetical protein
VSISAATHIRLLCCLTSLLCLAFATNAKANFGDGFGIAEFSGNVAYSDGTAYTQAGGHPYEVTTRIQFNDLGVPGTKEEMLLPDGNVKDVTVSVPPGLIGNAQAFPSCGEAALEATEAGTTECPPETQVGIAVVGLPLLGGTDTFPVWNVDPPHGYPAAFGFNVAGNAIVRLHPTVRTGGDYGIDIASPDTSQAQPSLFAEVKLWGNPYDESHDPMRAPRGTGIICFGKFNCFGGGASVDGLPETAFLTNPTRCTNTPQTTTIRTDSWQKPGFFHTASFTHNPNGEPLIVDGCEKVPFQPALEASPTSASADSPSGLSVNLRMPLDGLESPDGVAESALKGVTMTLPEGMAVNPASASGLSACSAAEIQLDGPHPARCPAASRLGKVEIRTPLLGDTLEGGIYLAKQGENKFGSLLALYLAVNHEDSGTVVKLAGRVQTDPRTGRLTASFDDNPQIPFEELRVELFGGPRASLLTPPACGTYTTTATMTPWSGGDPVTSQSSFTLDSGPNGGPCPSGKFEPKLDGGTVSPIAGRHSPLALQLTRADGTQLLRGLTISLPEGLLGSLRGIPYCPDAALAAIPVAEGSGAGQLTAPSCPAASQVGELTVGAGAGASPFYLSTGRIYLAGPYRGAPLSLAVLTPVVAGPFDLGNVLVRTALNVDPTSARITAVSDPLPTILHGIPLDLRDLRINVNRSKFVSNPTNCNAKAIGGEASSPAGATAKLNARFQVTNCAALPFKPKLAMRFFGKTHRSAHPRLRATLTMPKDGANIRKAVVTMPKTQFLENAHIRTICTGVQWAAKNCPKAAIYGYAKAFTPLLDKPLRGPVYLRSSDSELPDLVADLDGQIEIDLVGRIDSVKERIRNTFLTVPDAPVSKFVLTMQGGKKGLLVNNTNLCKAKPRAKAQFDGQNGKISDSNPRVRIDCGKKKRGGGKKR